MCRFPSRVSADQYHVIVAACWSSWRSARRYGDAFIHIAYAALLLPSLPPRPCRGSAVIRRCQPLVVDSAPAVARAPLSPFWRLPAPHLYRPVCKPTLFSGSHFVSPPHHRSWPPAAAETPALWQYRAPSSSRTTRRGRPLAVGVSPLHRCCSPLPRQASSPGSDATSPLSSHTRHHIIAAVTTIFRARSSPLRCCYRHRLADRQAIFFHRHHWIFLPKAATCVAATLSSSMPLLTWLLAFVFGCCSPPNHRPCARVAAFNRPPCRRGGVSFPPHPHARGGRPHLGDPVVAAIRHEVPSPSRC